MCIHSCKFFCNCQSLYEITACVSTTTEMMKGQMNIISSASHLIYLYNNVYATLHKSIYVTAYTHVLGGCRMAGELETEKEGAYL